MSVQNQMTQSTTTSSPWRFVGVWIFLVLIIYILYSAALAFILPQDFAETFGPNTPGGTSTFIQVYAIRTLFLGVYGLILLLQRDIKAAARFLLVATIIPLGDTVLVATKAAPPQTIIKNLIIALVILLTGLLLQRWALKHTMPLSSEQ